MWSFCPVQIPVPSAIPTITSSGAGPSTTGALGVIGASETPALGSISRIDSTDSIATAARKPRQEHEKRQVNLATVSVYPTTVGSDTSYVIPTALPSLAGEVLYSNGPYVCGTTVTLTTLASLLNEYLAATEDTLQAHVKLVTLNLHAAASYLSPTSPAAAPKQSALPSQNELIGALLYANLSSYLFTPDFLQQSRANLNTSWAGVSSQYAPDPSYYTSELGPGNVLTSSDGWPSESYVEFRNARRLLLGFGNVDPQMAGYNFSGEDSFIFPPNYITRLITVTQSASGNIESGCIYAPDSTSLSLANSSWAISSAFPVPDFSALNMSSTNLSLPAVTNLTACGISPFLNATLLNTTADVDVTPYRAFAYSSVWSWAPDEPDDTDLDSDDEADVRCAALSAVDPAGRWTVQDCGAKHRVACRITGSDPYGWTISHENYIYSGAVNACPTGSVFDVPRTALENRYLLAAFLNSSSYSPTGDVLLWLNFNDFDEQSCWVAGVNGTCPYINAGPMVSVAQQIVVPTVAAIIVLILALATLLVKCGANRRKARSKRKRGVGGWDYEGVPS